jgi:hypothetical protein
VEVLNASRVFGWCEHMNLWKRLRIVKLFLEIVNKTASPGSNQGRKDALPETTEH